MAILSSAEILQILQEKQRPEELESCRIHDSRARFHTEPYLRSPVYQSYTDQFLAWVNLIIDKDKHAVFRALMTLPIETIDFTEGVFDELKKVFEAQNRYIGSEFTNPQLEADFEEYRKQIGDFDFWKTKGFKAMKSAINSFVIIDLPPIDEEDEGTEDDAAPKKAAPKYPQPYYYLLDCQRVVDVDIDCNNNVEYIIFVDGYDQKMFYAFDDQFYRVFREIEGQAQVAGQTVASYEMVSETPHDLGYTPARSFWSTPYNDKSIIQKSGPISNSLSKLDWLLFMYTSTKHSELQAGFPVEVIYEQRCDYKDAEGNACEGGKIRKNVRTQMLSPRAAGDGYSYSTGTQVVYDDCPTCKNKNQLGAGRLLTAPAMASKDDVDLIQGMNRIGADVPSLEYLLKRIDGLETGIAINVVGYTDEDLNEAINKEQVASRYQSQFTVLIEVKENFENIHKFVLETLGKLRYGKAFVSATVNYGDKFFIYSVDALQEEYTSAKTNGFPVYELGSQINQIIETKYKENPTMLERARILGSIEPYVTYTMTELINLNGAIPLNQQLIRLKADFESYVNRFEREYMNVAQFMQYSPMESRVEFIKNAMLEYVNEDYAEQDAADQAAADAEAKAKADALAAQNAGQNPPNGGTGSGAPPASGGTPAQA